MRWIKNAYVTLVGQDDVLQTVTVSFDGGWLHVRSSDREIGDRVTSYPAQAVEKVLWDDPKTGSPVRTD